MTDKLQETVNRENALHGETLIEDGATTGAGGSASPDKREELKARIAAGQSRHEQRGFADQAKEAAKTAADFAKEHPIATVAGGLALGLLIGSMTRSGRRLGREAGSLASSATEAATAFALGLLDDATDIARQGKETLGEATEKLAFSGRQANRDADYYTRTLSDKATTTSRLVGRSLSRRLRNS